MTGEQRMVHATAVGTVAANMLAKVLADFPECNQATAMGLVVAQFVDTAAWFPEWGQFIAALLGAEMPMHDASRRALLVLLPTAPGEVQG